MKICKENITRWIVFKASEFCSQKHNTAEMQRAIDYLLASENKDILRIRKRLIKTFPNKHISHIKNIEELFYVSDRR